MACCQNPEHPSVSFIEIRVCAGVCAGVYDVRIALCYIATGKAHQAYQKPVWGICAKRCAPAHISLWAFRSTCCCDWVCARYAPARFQAMAESWPYGPSACNMGTNSRSNGLAKPLAAVIGYAPGMRQTDFKSWPNPSRMALALAKWESLVDQWAWGLQSYWLL